jgi:(p)ppGpp synthase/HD superfamily hydrolase
MSEDNSRFRDSDDLRMLDGFALAPYIKMARSLISKKRSLGRNAFTHAIGTMAIAIDYKYNNSLILKGALCHDYLEDAEWAKESDIAYADRDGFEVLEIVRELTYYKDKELKKDYLLRLRHARFESKVIKLCDRLDNLYTLLPGAISTIKITRIIKETEEYILPIAEEISPDFVKEINDLLESRRKYLEKYLRIRRKSNYHDIFEYYHELNYTSTESE